MSKKILVTGGAGFIGSHTVVELVKSGYTSIIIDNLSNSEKSVLSGIEKILGSKPVFYEGNFQDKALLNQVTKEHKIDGVIHFAASKKVGESVEKPLLYYQNNVSGLLTLLEFMEESKIPNLIFSSSATVYGNTDKLPITEEAPMQPAESPYGATKQMGEIIINDTTKVSKNLRSLSLRYFNPIGAHPSANIGELALGTPANLVPFVTQTAAGIRPSLTIFGNDYSTPDGTCIRDYIHVVDLARAHVKALGHVSNQSSSYYDVFNIGTGKGSSVLEVIETFEKITGKKVPYTIGDRRSGDVVQSYAAVDKANKTLAWKSELTLADALRDSWAWQQQITLN